MDFIEFPDLYIKAMETYDSLRFGGIVESFVLPVTLIFGYKTLTTKEEKLKPNNLEGKIE